MPDYSHLQTPIADTRYVMAAHYLEPCEHIIEVGGHRIKDFMPDEHPRDRNPRFFWNIDPSANAESWDQVKTYKMPVTAFSFDNTLAGRTKNGLCLLGMEMYDEEYGHGEGMQSAQHICKSMHHFNIVVMEFVGSNHVAYQQSLLILGAARAVGFGTTVCFTTQWAVDNKYPEPNASFSKVRDFWVLEKQ